MKPRAFIYCALWSGQAAGFCLVFSASQRRTQCLLLAISGHQPAWNSEQFRPLGIDPETIEAAKARMALVKSPAIELTNNELELPSNDYVRAAARLITWYDLYVQLAIGILFLFGRRITDFVAHLCLLFFIFTTYLPAPFFGFGWTLSIMGAASQKIVFVFFTSYILCHSLLFYYSKFRGELGS